MQDVTLTLEFQIYHADIERLKPELKLSIECIYTAFMANLTINDFK